MPLSSVGVTKVTIEVRRVDKAELVSVLMNLPPQLGFYKLITPIPTAPNSVLFVQVIERFLGIPSGACQLV